MAKEPKFVIGTNFKTRHRHPKIGIVIDIWRTYNTANELVKLRYVVIYKFAGQTVTDYDVTETTIAMGLI